MKGKIAAIEHAAIDGRPLGKDDFSWIITYCHQREGVTTYDIFFKDVFDRISAILLRLLFEQAGVFFVEDVKKPLAAFYDIIFEDVYAVDTGHGENGIPLIFQLAIFVPGFNNTQFPFENFRQEIARAAGRFKKTGVNPLRFLLYKVKHGIDLAFAGQHLAMVGYPLF